MSRPLRVFVSSTSKDLLRHRKAVRDVAEECGFELVGMENFGAVAAHSVAACRGFVAGCDLVLALIAFRRGWVPTPGEGGDGLQSVTGLEIEASKWLGKPLYLFLADASWPGTLYDDDPEALAWVKTFRDGLNQPAEFFSALPLTPGQTEPEPTEKFRNKVEKTLLKHTAAVLKGQHPARTPGRDELEFVLTALDGGLRTAPHVTAADLLGAVSALGCSPQAATAVEAAYRCAGVLADRSPRPDGTVPLVEFVRAAARFLPEKSSQLLTWAGAAETRLNVPPPAPTRPDPAPRRPDVSAAFRAPRLELVIAVRAAGLAAGPLRADYEAACPPGWHPVPYEPDPLRAVDEYGSDLARAGLVGGRHPLLDFARGLLARGPAPLRPPLDAAILLAAQAVGEEDPKENPQPAHKQPPGPAPSYLLVAVHLHPMREGMYQVHGWFAPPLGQRPECLTTDSAVFALAALPAALPGEVERMRCRVRDWTNLAELRVELFLPLELLSQDVDRWAVTARWNGGTPALKRPLGTQHQLLVRPAPDYFGERAWREARLHNLRKRWATALRVTRHPPAPGDVPGCAYHLPPATDIERLFDQLEFTCAVAAVALGAPAPDRAACDPLATLALVPLPVVVWYRNGPEAPDELARLLEGGDVALLPARVLAFRRAAAAHGDEHPGHHVGVLYDDPERQPPELQLTTPSEAH